MRISVAMCTRNGSRFVREQLESIARQSRSPDLVVVSDDASTDETPSIVTSFANEVSFPVRLFVNERCLGTTKNFERAIFLCDGDVIALSDQDDVWSPDKLKVIENALQSDVDAAGAFSDASIVDDLLGPIADSLWDRVGFTREERGLFRSGRAIDVLSVHNVVTGATLAFRSSFREVVLPIPEEHQMVHDRWIAFVLAACSRLVAIDTPLVSYRQHEAQQIGAGPAGDGLLRWVEDGSRTGRVDYHLWHRQLGLVLARLESLRQTRAIPDLSPLRLRMAHLETRGTLPDARLRRVPVILRELVALRYHRFSNGLWSAVKDLFLP